jgi:hypothetical protein
MNIFFRSLSVCVLAAIIVTIVACGGHHAGPDPTPEPTQKEKVTAQLTKDGGTWSLPASGGILVDGTTDASEYFKDFSIKFAATTFTTTGTTPVFLRTDTWHFKDDNANVIIRGQDNKEITITSISDTQLKFSLTWDQTTTEPGRTKSIPGTYSFILNK